MIKNQRNKFSLPVGGTYLNCAYMSPLLKSVERAAKKGLIQKRNPATVTPIDFFETGERLRKEFSRLIGSKAYNRAVIIPSVSYGLANAAANIPLSPGQNIIVAGEQFPSNYYPWHRLAETKGATLKTIAAPVTTKQRGKIWNERILDGIDKQTRVVAIGHVHWADGTFFDLEAIRARTKEVGALLIVDGTQSVGALPFDVKKIQPDALICAGYKWLLGPYSIGMAYYGEYFDGGKPLEENWINRKFSEDFAGLVNYQSQYQDGALRYEVGEHSNFILAPMLLEALRQINEWKPSHIQAYTKRISTEAIDHLRQAGFWIEEQSWRGNHLFGVRLPAGMDVQKVKKLLAAKKISVSFRGNAIRVSPHLYNTETDLQKLASTLTSLRK